MEIASSIMKSFAFVHASMYVKMHLKWATKYDYKDFQDWIDSNYGLHVSIETARSWLHNIGLTRNLFINFDGHERDDVTQYRKVFVDHIID